MPLYHKALQEQAAHQREQASAEQAGQLGLPVVRFESGRGSLGTEMSFEGDEDGFVPETSREGAVAGAGGPFGHAGREEVGDGMRRDPVQEQEGTMRNSRASSGVFSESRGDERYYEVEMEGKGKDVYRKW